MYIFWCFGSSVTIFFTYNHYTAGSILTHPEEVATLAGTIYQIESSFQHREGEQTGLGTSRVQHAFKIDMNEVAKLNPGEAFVIRQRDAAKIRVKPVESIPSAPDQMPQVRDISTKTGDGGDQKIEHPEL